MGKSKKGQPVNVHAKSGIIKGIIKRVEVNLCTFEIQYDIEYRKDGKNWTMICIPETAITSLNS